MFIRIAIVFIGIIIMFFDIMMIVIYGALDILVSLWNGIILRRD